eukprot:72108_1
MSTEPPDTPERSVFDAHSNVPSTCMKPVDPDTSDPATDWRHPGWIPAAGRGNSDGGTAWVNPSAAQLQRACRRKGKDVGDGDKEVVAAIHGDVLTQTWARVLEYERLHKCVSPTLSRFEGLSHKHSPKAKFLHWLGYPLPFDRHDWVVNRCGKEVTYIIDYYGGNFGKSAPINGGLVIDCRPKLTPAGIFDRAHLAVRKFWWRHFSPESHSL